MPEMPTVQIDPSVFNEVPAREGESSAVLNLEHQRRKAAMIQELKKDLAELEGKTKLATGSRAANLRHRSLQEKRAELKGLTRFDGERWHGPCAPATVLNFNPIEMRLQGELMRWTIPFAGAPGSRRITISYNGRSFTASYMTIDQPHIWPVVTDARDGALGIDISIEARYIPPIGLAHQFYDHYVSGASDAQGIGGVVIFEGDVHTLKPERLEKTQGCIWVPKANLPTDRSGRVFYTVEKESWQDVLEDSLTRQRAYAQGVIAEGDRYYNSSADIIRNQLSDYHKLWHNWACDMGYKKTREPWATESLDDGPNVEAVHCPNCHNRQSDPKQYFCSNCNTPFDACKAFLAGKNVSLDQLAAYDESSPEFALIMAEMKRRKANIAKLSILTVDDEEKSGKKGKKAE